MATLADLKTRIITETNRDDLSDTLATQLLTHIQRACEYYADELFWFNSLVANVVTVSHTATVAIPVTFRRIDQVVLPAYFTEIQEKTLGNMPIGTIYGVPNCYAYYNDTLTFYPIPNAVYTLELTGLAQIDAPVAAGDTSVWTDEAQDLIVSRAKMTLYRDQFRDPEGTQMAIGATQEHFAKLKRETAKRLETKLTGRAARRRYNIYVE